MQDALLGETADFAGGAGGKFVPVRQLMGQDLRGIRHGGQVLTEAIMQVVPDGAPLPFADLDQFPLQLFPHQDLLRQRGRARGDPRLQLMAQPEERAQRPRDHEVSDEMSE